ncbi:hypothetical protein KFE25_000561 [Diacronema lutheri]|uniref:Non-structural maintenance of chromosomes element 1 homolog n=2 Tax=Diacronema lutheri TaxID=2081491 RepID=A0A8J5XXI4_DIALT|nr:hypothetical protein KFE25_000561 [Diacronema lutheri]
MVHDMHRAMLQSLLGAGEVSEDEMLALTRQLVDIYRADLATSRYRRYTSAAVNGAMVDDCVNEINHQLEFLALKVAKAHCASDGAFHYALVNLVHDDHANKGHTFMPAQIALFAKVRDEIEQNEEGAAATGVASIDVMGAENLRLDLGQGLKMDDALYQTTIEKLIAQRWLEVGGDDESEIRLGPRSVLQAQY